MAQPPISPAAPTAQTPPSSPAFSITGGVGDSLGTVLGDSVGLRPAAAQAAPPRRSRTRRFRPSPTCRRGPGSSRRWGGTDRWTEGVSNGCFWGSPRRGGGLTHLRSCRYRSSTRRRSGLSPSDRLRAAAFPLLPRCGRAGAAFGVSGGTERGWCDPRNGRERDWEPRPAGVSTALEPPVSSYPLDRRGVPAAEPRGWCPRCPGPSVTAPEVLGQRLPLSG